MKIQSTKIKLCYVYKFYSSDGRTFLNLTDPILRIHSYANANINSLMITPPSLLMLKISIHQELKTN